MALATRLRRCLLRYHCGCWRWQQARFWLPFSRQSHEPDYQVGGGNLNFWWGVYSGGLRPPPSPTTRVVARVLRRLGALACCAVLLVLGAGQMVMKMRELATRNVELGVVRAPLPRAPRASQNGCCSHALTNVDMILSAVGVQLGVEG